MWKSIIQDLLDSGYTQGQLAGAVGVAQTTISELLHERIREPGWSKGKALLQLHMQEFGARPGYQRPCCED